jgi:hypothetical protein
MCQEEAVEGLGGGDEYFTLCFAQRWQAWGGGHRGVAPSGEFPGMEFGRRSREQVDVLLKWLGYMGELETQPHFGSGTAGTAAASDDLKSSVNEEAAKKNSLESFALEEAARSTPLPEAQEANKDDTENQRISSLTIEKREAEAWRQQLHEEESLVSSPLRHGRREPRCSKRKRRRLC